MPNNDLKVKFNRQSPNRKMSDETKAEKSENADDNSVSQPIAKPSVVGSQSRVTIGDVQNILDELNPILNELNSALAKRSLNKKDISFSWRGDKITAFISCD